MPRTLRGLDGKSITMEHWFDLEGVYEMDYDGGTGALMGFHIDGHGHDPSLIELLLADENFLEGELMGYDYEHTYFWDVKETWVGTQPFVDDEDEEHDDAWVYVYSSEPKEGYRAVTFFDESQIPRHWCVVHPFEPYQRAIPANHFADGVFNYVLADLDSGRTSWGHDPGYVYLCKECAAHYEVLYSEGYKQALLELAFDDQQEEERLRQTPHEYKPNEEDGQVYCFHVVDPRKYRAVPYICGLAEDATPHVTFKEQQ